MWLFQVEMRDPLDVAHDVGALNVTSFTSLNRRFYVEQFEDNIKERSVTEKRGIDKRKTNILSCL